ncbi:MAG: ABC transporter permease subunit [Candidatus Cloacimonetes bacterium]|nr:ABC transporter permease subunit [Candidatus Cloacimonadota bacterium]
MKVIKISLFYIFLVVLTIIFSTPLIWMMTTSLKVSGTGDKHIYFPQDLKSFYTVKVTDLSNIGIKVSSEINLDLAIRDLYANQSVPSINSIVNALGQLSGAPLNSTQISDLKAKYSNRFNINTLTAEQFQKQLPMTLLDAQAIVSYRKAHGNFDLPEDLLKVPQFNDADIKDLQENRKRLKNSNYVSIAKLKKQKKFTRQQVSTWKRLLYSNTLYTGSNFNKVLFEFEPRDNFTLVDAFINSMIVAVGTALLTVFISLLGGYVFAKKQFFGKDFLWAMFWSSMLIPGMMFIVPQYAIISRFGFINTYAAMIVPHCASIFGLYLMRQYIEGIPHSLFEAAYMDGANEVDLFSIIIIPLTKPIIATLFLMTFLSQWSNFLWQLIVNTSDSPYSTLPVILGSFKGQYVSDWTLLMAGSSVMLIPIVILFLCAQKYFVAGMTAGAVKE